MWTTLACAGRVGVVVLGQEDAACDHDEKRHERQAAERIRELVGVLGNRILQPFDAEPLVERVDGSAPPRAT